MVTKVTLGPYMSGTNGRYAQQVYVPAPPPVGLVLAWKCAGESYPFVSNVRSLEVIETKSDAIFRVKPKGIALLSAMTNHSHSKSTATGGLTMSGCGNMIPEQRAGNCTRVEIAIKSSNRSVENLLAKVKNETWNLSTFLGELPETVNFLRSVASGLMTSYLAVKRGDMRKLQNTIFPRKKKRESYYGRKMMSKTASDKWLQWRYAVQPMVYDMDDMLKTLYEASTRPLISHKYASASEFWNLIHQGGEVLGESNYTCRTKTGLYYKVNPSVQAFKQLGLLNPLATLYELTPLSFVVDWFLPVGKYIAGLDAMAGVSVIGKYQSQKARAVENVRYNAAYGASPGFPIGSSVNSSFFLESFTRNSNPSLSIPVPSFQLGQNMNQVIDSFALMRNILIRK